MPDFIILVIFFSLSIFQNFHPSIFSHYAHVEILYSAAVDFIFYLFPGPFKIDFQFKIGQQTKKNKKWIKWNTLDKGIFNVAIFAVDVAKKWIRWFARFTSNK